MCCAVRISGGFGLLWQMTIRYLAVYFFFAIDANGFGFKAEGL